MTPEPRAVWVGERWRHGGVDEIPLPAGVDGRLWLCGKHFVGPDIDLAMAAVAATRVVCLNRAAEIEPRYPEYVAWLRADERAHWFPIDDLHAPPLGEARELLAVLRRWVGAGESVLMHCGAGVGRAGTMAAALLMALGAARDEAVRTVATHRPMAGPEAGAQVELLEALAAGT